MHSLRSSKGRRWLPAMSTFTVTLLLSVTTPFSSSFALTSHVAGSVPAYTFEPKGYTMLASPKHTIWAYNLPGKISPRKIPATSNGSPVTMPVISVNGSYLLVRLPGRPNGSIAWVKRGGVNLSATPYRIKIYLRTMHLVLFYKGVKKMSAPIGVGTVTDPTPHGRFFVTSFAAPTQVGYGPFVMVTSAHSNTITDWQQSGDALIAIHGPLGADAQIGRSGARVSHGCIRMHVRDQRRLSVVPIGTPIGITGYH